jgi:hypothetical protein
MFDSRRSRRRRPAVPLEQPTDIGLFTREHIVEPGHEMTQLVEGRPLEPSDGLGGDPEDLADFGRGAHRRAQPESKGARSLLLGDIERQPVEDHPWALRIRRFALGAGVGPDAIRWMDHDVVSQ